MHWILEGLKGEYRIPVSCAWAPLILAAALGLPACLFAAEAKAPALRIHDSSAGAAQASGHMVVREIDDPATGRRWLLELDPSHPGGPGRLVQVSRTTPVFGKNRQVRSAPWRSTQAIHPSPFQPIIRAGDWLVVEQDTSVIEARLEAVAMEPARKGATFRVRLMIGGRVVRAIALVPGRASLAPETGGWQ